jgi:hypothetical protein
LLSNAFSSENVLVTAFYTYPEPTPVSPSSLEALVRERKELVKEMHRIQDRLARIEQEIGPYEDEGEVIEGQVDAAA